MNDTANDQELIPLRDVPIIVKRMTGHRKRTTANTIYRWARKGVRGRKLQTQPVGGTLCTTRAWLNDFFAPREPVSTGIDTPTPRERQRAKTAGQRMNEQAHQRLRDLGLIQ
ncbi:DUF1580 domain-containing protein [Roseiconus lacunae]|uniref:DUF1580 domain-containing protein n=1 Tax=Roseiconus lacunae TaxID=2605694 RepID=A0ABT7PH30_9BACT|nr:DUF1580 domain-containing protein [Roseiconus lacunae]MDM4015809.1 DUF1580 domain-containing protein [Roseiconus lacunae]